MGVTKSVRKVSIDPCGIC